MIDTGYALEMFELACGRCGRPEPDTFEDAGALAALLMDGVPGIRAVTAAQVTAAGRPAHLACLATRRRPRQAPYDLMRSLA